MSQIQEGDNLPSVRELAENIGINMHTVNKAYTILKQEGYVKLDRRKGAVIAVDCNKEATIIELKEQLRVLLAQAICKNVTVDEVHQIVDTICKEFLEDEK